MNYFTITQKSDAIHGHRIRHNNRNDRNVWETKEERFYRELIP